LPTNLPPDTTDEVRPHPFSDASILARIDAELAQVPAGDRVCFLLTGTLEDGEIVGRTSVMVRLPAGWSFGGFLEAGNRRGAVAGVKAGWSR